LGSRVRGVQFVGEKRFMECWYSLRDIAEVIKVMGVKGLDETRNTNINLVINVQREEIIWKS